MPGRNPLVQVAPPSVEVAKPISVPPPLKMRPTWNALTIVEPKANVSGSTSVACWLLALVKVSVLNLVSGISGGVLMFVNAEVPEPQAGVIASKKDRTIRADNCCLILSWRDWVITAKQYNLGASWRAPHGPRLVT